MMAAISCVDEGTISEANCKAQEVLRHIRMATEDSRAVD